MVRFCRNCKRGLDDTDKFCRNCGKDTIDSISYQDFYNLDIGVDVNVDVNVVRVEVAEKKKEKGVVEDLEKTDENDKNNEANKLLEDLLPKEGDKKVDQRLLINKNRGGHDKQEQVEGEHRQGIKVLSGEVGKKINRKRGKFVCYEKAIVELLPIFIKDIDKSEDGSIRVRVSDIVKKMGLEFERKSLPSIFFGLKYVLFSRGLWIRVGTLKDDSKMFIIRRRNDNDILPPSLIRRQGMEEKI